MITFKKTRKNIDGIVSTTNVFPQKRKNFSFSQRSKKIFFFLSLSLTFSFVGGFLFFTSEEVKGATYAWIQSNWSGGVSTETALHPTGQNDWNMYESTVGIMAGDSLSLIREQN